MKTRQDPKYVYIFGNDTLGFHGHTYDKDDVKKILKNRKHLKVKKIKNDNYCKAVLSVNTEFIDQYRPSYITCDEEEFFIEAFTQFKQDILKHIDTLVETIKFIKFNDDEKQLINFLITYLLDYQEYMLNGQYEDGGELYETLFNNTEAMKWFVANVLDPQ